MHTKNSWKELYQMKFTMNMNRKSVSTRIILLLMVFAFGVMASSCNRYGCKGIDQNTGEFKMKKKAKTTSGLFPKGKKGRR